MTKNHLKQYVTLEMDLKRMEEKMKSIENSLLAPVTSRFSSMPKSAPLGMEEKMERLLELQAFYQKRVNRLLQKRLEIEQALSCLDDPLERTVLGYKYIDGLCWEDVCNRIHYEHRQTHRIHKKALEHLGRMA